MSAFSLFFCQIRPRFLAASCLPVILLFLAGCATPPQQDRLIVVPEWDRLEWTLESSANYANPVQQAELRATFT